VSPIVLYMKKTKITLDENEIPKKWYNIQADLKTPMDPPLHPQTRQPISPDDLKAIFPMELIKQEMSRERYITIPSEVREIYRIWRPSPLYRARRLEKALKTPAEIYYKCKVSVHQAAINPTQRSHKPITTKKKGSNDSSRKQEPDNGDQPLLLVRNSLISNVASTW
jgi:predicted alternative tryptophan synthase beta-subunit